MRYAMSVNDVACLCLASPPPSPAFLHRHAHALPWLSRSHERTVGAGAGYVVHRLHVRQTRPRSAPTW